MSEWSRAFGRTDKAEIEPRYMLFASTFHRCFQLDGDGKDGPTDTDFALGKVILPMGGRIRWSKTTPDRAVNE
jgi:hypothetical protein